ncbi:guanylate kinase [Myxococcota bacterium]|nr:guanylate kinase [Myxococcota bacterium]MBU1537217.1 guanylate kinase [Myxococcota bacterium]
MNEMIFVVTAPSGAGKTTLIKRLTAEYPRLSFSVSTTTRKPREGEIHGLHYHFTTDEVFDEMIAQGEFMEWAHIHQNRYGTSRKAAMEVLARGDELLLDVDMQGGEALRREFGTRANFIFIVTPSLDVLRERLMSRGTENPESLAIRLGNAKKELTALPSYDFVVVNDDLDRAYEELKSVYTACHYRVSLRPLHPSVLK